MLKFYVKRKYIITLSLPMCCYPPYNVGKIMSTVQLLYYSWLVLSGSLLLADIY